MINRKPTRKGGRKAVKVTGGKPVHEQTDSTKTSSGISLGSKDTPGRRHYRAKVRMYRQGLGDCFLLTFPRKDGKPFHVVIDCGVILGTRDSGAIMKEVVQHIIATTEGNINLLAATHEHWDHISGFAQARDLWTDTSRLIIDEVWLSWAEDFKDPLAQKLREQRQTIRLALDAAAARMRVAGHSQAAEEVTNLLTFSAAATTTAQALQVVKGLSSNLRYCKPNENPVKLPGTNVTVYVLGPPPDEKFIKKYNPSRKAPETYGMDSMNLYLAALKPALESSELNSPFDPRYQIPLHVAQQMPFFQNYYWGEHTDSIKTTEDWRRIDNSWLDSSAVLALQLDNATNNTCLVLAFELEDGDVLLFAADAQVGNWLSWQDLKWTVDGREVTGPDLLSRTVCYKVGHHGSHNATLRELGLEEMKKLKLAFVPVDGEMAIKKRWHQMPLSGLMKRLDEITNECVVRIDQDIPTNLKDSMKTDHLYHEVVL